MLPTEGRLLKWQHQYDQVILQQMMGLADQRRMFQEIMTIIRSNPRLPKRSIVYSWLAQCYAHSAAAAVRRQRDEDRRSISLWRLLKDIENHPRDLTRNWYVSQWASMDQDKGNQIFNGFASKGQATIDPAIIRRDRIELESLVARIKRFVDDHIAHRSATPAVPPTFAALNAAIDATAKLVARYGLLLRQAPGMGKSHPILPKDWLEVFRVPWIDPRRERAQRVRRRRTEPR
jgi:hypothetical protein